MIRQIKTKPVKKEAIQFTGKNYLSCGEFMNAQTFTAGLYNHKAFIIIQTLEGKMRADEGDWIIKGLNGEFYPCKPDIFERTYEFLDCEEA